MNVKHRNPKSSKVSNWVSILDHLSGGHQRIGPQKWLIHTVYASNLVIHFPNLPNSFHWICHMKHLAMSNLKHSVLTSASCYPVFKMGTMLLVFQPSLMLIWVHGLTSCLVKRDSLRCDWATDRLTLNQLNIFNIPKRIQFAKNKLKTQIPSSRIKPTNNTKQNRTKKCKNQRRNKYTQTINVTKTNLKHPKST